MLNSLIRHHKSGHFEPGDLLSTNLKTTRMLKTEKMHSFRYEIMQERRPWPIPRLHGRLLALSEMRVSFNGGQGVAESVANILSNVYVYTE